jgi:hypothetical protein
METLGEHPELLRLHDRIAELEGALADARQDLRLTRAWFQLACLGKLPAIRAAAEESSARQPLAMECWRQNSLSA